MIIVEILSREEIAKDSTQISIRRCLTEVKGADVVEIGSEFFRETSVEILCADHFPFQDHPFLLCLISGLDTLPREGATEEVEEYVPERLQVVGAILHWDGHWYLSRMNGEGALTNAEMTVDAGKACRADQMSFCDTDRIGLDLVITTFRGKAISVAYTTFPHLTVPIRKFSGLTSRWMMSLEWMCSRR